MSRVLAIAVFAVGCGSSSLSPSVACLDSASALCERLYACFTPEELATAGYPTDEAACVTGMEAQDGCVAQTAANACIGNEVYNGDAAATCTDQITGLSCSQIRDPLFSLDADAPACAEVCAIPA